MKKLLFSAALIATGTFAMAQQNMKMEKKDPAQMEQMRAERMKKMQTDLNLTDAQLTKIRSLHEKQQAERVAKLPEMQAERQAKREAMQAKRTQYQNDMKQILTPEQYTKWQAQKDNKMQRKAQHMKQGQMHKKYAK